MKYGHIIILAVSLVAPAMADCVVTNPLMIAQFGVGTVHLLPLTMVAVLGLWFHAYGESPSPEMIIFLSCA
ncbi:hypothetical protein CCHR01_19004 [Colletotrichum chrysophilum]|uniref:Uncharacterized protein n=1 Tax=Colletotrichum chrysophilum TaxID=1836956 RepID=A0AAD9A1C7_9PEZI|nr:hypothetical protein CCHR01_19004 [Colletotrichum chrysophilum]